MPGLSYYRRIFSAYLLGGKSHLTFWHEPRRRIPMLPPTNSATTTCSFRRRRTTRAFDSNGIPQLDYHGQIGLQYNPIAIAQYGLGNYNYGASTAILRGAKILSAPPTGSVSTWSRIPTDWRSGTHHFNWEYRDTLQAPWYSAWRKGRESRYWCAPTKNRGDSQYLDAAQRAFAHFSTSHRPEGGVAFTDESGDLWFEEYIVSPPTHILNGFIWALWGVYDYFLATEHQSAQELFSRAVRTLLHNLDRYDLGFWSLYEQSGTRLPMVASPFYHRLHIVQLRMMHRLTGEQKFAQVADRWENYARSRANRARALCYKSAFKLCYY